MGVRLRAFLGSDIGHWDVPNMADVIAEAHGLVRKGLLTDDDFRDFVFRNPVSLHTGANRDFFKNTVVEKEVERCLAEEGNRNSS